MKFYKFQSCDYNGFVNLIHLIAKNEIYMSSILSQKDSYDGKYDAHNLYDIDVPDEFYNRLTRRYIYSLTGAEDENFIISSESVQMWSLYADGSKGFCIEFNDNLLINKTSFFKIRQVEYKNSPVDGDITNAYGETADEKLENIICSKSLKFKDENEYRIFGSVKGYMEIPDSVCSIYCGDRIDKENCKFIKRLADLRGWSVYLLKAKTNEYGFLKIQL